MNRIGRFNDFAVRLCLSAGPTFVFLVAPASVGDGLLTRLLPMTELVAPDGPVFCSEPVPDSNTLVPRRTARLASGFRWVDGKLHAGFGVGSRARTESLGLSRPYPDFEKGGEIFSVGVITEVYRC